MACALVWALEWEGLGSRVGVGRFGLTDWCGKVWAHQLGCEGLDSRVGLGRFGLAGWGGKVKGMASLFPWGSFNQHLDNTTTVCFVFVLLLCKQITSI